jgi:hypothetical protein
MDVTFLLALIGLAAGAALALILRQRFVSRR